MSLAGAASKRYLSNANGNTFFNLEVHFDSVLCDWPTVASVWWTSPGN
jgi:hypothetical protein